MRAPDGNRTAVSEAGVTFYYAYDATDEVLWKGPNANGSGSSAFSYDALGNLLSSQPSGPDSGSLKPTTYTYDPAGHLLTIDDGTAAQKVTFTIDAAGRHASEVIGSGATTTYEYLGTSDVISSETTSGVTTYSGIDAIGDRLSQGSGASVSGWLIADLHGNIVAAASSGSSPAYLDAYRYDPYGETCGSWAASSGSLTVPWRFQGRILESDIGAGTDLYDFGARAYDPDLGAFTSFDTVSGSALNPLTLNRYLYASANPETLVDPDGHVNCGGGPPSAIAACEAAAEPPSPVSQPVSHPNTELFNCSGAPASSAAECEAAKAQAVFDAQLQTARAELTGSTDMTTAAYDSVLHDSVLYDTTDSGSAVYSYDSGVADAKAAAAAGASSRSNVDCGWNPLCDINNAVGTAGDVGRGVAGNPAVQWTAAIAATGIVCLGLGAGLACGAAGLAYVGTTWIKNKLEGNSDLLAGANPSTWSCRWARQVCWIGIESANERRLPTN